VEFCVLGRVSVVVDGHEHVLTSARESGLLADLLVHANEVVPVERLVDDVWHGAPPRGAAATLQTYVKNLRRLMEPARAARAPSQVLERVGSGYVLHVGPEQLDAWRCGRLVKEGLAALAAGETPAAAQRLAEAEALWRGPAYGDLAREGHLQAEAVRLAELRLVMTEARVEVGLAQGRHRELCGELEALVGEHPYRERFWEHLMLALYRAGRQADALRAFQRVRTLLGEELGIEPGEALQRLDEAILLQKPELDFVPCSDEATSPEARRGTSRSLADQLLHTTPFVGRDVELTQLADLLSAAAQRPPGGTGGDARTQWHPRLVTIAGPAGIGKTRLALRAAADADSGFPDGVWFVPLAPVDDPDAVPEVVIAVLGSRRLAGESTLSSLVDLARGRRMLVVLDNCEHVLAGAAACAEAILDGGDGVVLATSREALFMPGEQVVPLTAMELDAAVTLFVDRACAVDPSFELVEGDRDTVVEICRQLDGLPLAIELAAGRMRSMTVAELLANLGSRFRLLRRDRGAEPRHRSLQAAVEWSFDLLDPSERDLFPQLSVFAGGFNRHAVEAVCTGDAVADPVAVAEALDALVNRSMVVADRSRATTRYSLLETLRQFGDEELDGRGDRAELRSRHARHFLDIAESARRQMSTPDLPAAVTRFDNEWDNLRTAFDWFEANGDIDGALRLVVACDVFAYTDCRFELLAWGERAIAVPDAVDHDLWPAATGVTSGLLRFTNDPEGAEVLALEALRIERERHLQPRFEPASALLWACNRRDMERFALVLVDAERIAERDGDPIHRGHARYARTLVHYYAAPGQGIDFAEEALRDARTTGNPLQLALAWAGVVALNVRFDKAAALRALPEALRWAQISNYLLIGENAALWFSYAARDEEPLEALTYARHAIAGARIGRYAGNLDLSLGVILLPLIRFGRTHSAALILGGLASLPENVLDTEVLAQARVELTDALGPDLDRLVAEGSGLATNELARLALDEIDSLVGTADSA
jgi:predicted ATPase/DNA-binding SARP family transcriptional activator